MRSILKRITAVMMVVVMMVLNTACNKSENQESATIQVKGNVTLTLWYTDDAMTSYFVEAASKYHTVNPNVTLEPKLVSADDFLENIYNGSIRDNNKADLYMLSSDKLEQAYLSGLADANDKYPSVYNEQVYGKAGMQAAQYKEKLLGYPLTFDTTFFVYNKKYSSAMNTFPDITSFNANFQHTEENASIQVIMKWDVSDVMTNYGLFAQSFEIGGSSGDDSSIFEIKKDKLKEGLTAFSKFKNDFVIDRKTVKKENCISEFAAGHLMFTFAGTDDLKTFNDAGVEYGISKLPDISEKIRSSTVSETDLILVNPYSSNTEVAKNAARALSYEYASDIYGLAGKTSAICNLTELPSESYSDLYKLYSDSTVKAQFMNVGDFYLRLEILLHQVWDGGSVNDGVTSLENYINSLKKSTASQQTTGSTAK